MEIATKSHDVESTGVPNERMAMWVFLSSEIVLFGGLLATCVLFRMSYTEWREFAEKVNSTIGSINTIALLSSSLTIVLAHKYAIKGNYKLVNTLMFATILLGALFLCLKAVEYTKEISHGYTLTGGPFWMFYYGITGLHAIHVLVGVVIISTVLFMSLSGKKPTFAVENAGLYWHFVDVVWIFVFPLFYLS